MTGAGFRFVRARCRVVDVERDRPGVIPSWAPAFAAAGERVGPGLRIERAAIRRRARRRACALLVAVALGVAGAVTFDALVGRDERARALDVELEAHRAGVERAHDALERERLR